MKKMLGRWLKKAMYVHMWNEQARGESLYERAGKKNRYVFVTKYNCEYWCCKYLFCRFVAKCSRKKYVSLEFSGERCWICHFWATRSVSWSFQQFFSRQLLTYNSFTHLEEFHILFLLHMFFLFSLIKDAFVNSLSSKPSLVSSLRSEDFVLFLLITSLDLLPFLSLTTSLQLLLCSSIIL